MVKTLSGTTIRVDGSNEDGGLVLGMLPNLKCTNTKSGVVKEILQQHHNLAFGDAKFVWNTRILCDHEEVPFGETVHMFMQFGTCSRQ